MDGLEFADAVAGHLLSWPVAGLVIVATFHKKLGRLIDRLKHAEVAGQVFDFEEHLDRAAKLADTASGVPADATAQHRTMSGPTETLLADWASVERALRDAAGALGIDGSRATQSIPFQLATAGVVNENFVGAVHELRVLRNAVAHGEHAPTGAEAERYSQTARELVELCRLIAEGRM